MLHIEGHCFHVHKFCFNNNNNNNNNNNKNKSLSLSVNVFSAEHYWGHFPDRIGI